MTPQAPILTVTLNPALDLSTAADEVRPELKLRCDKPVADPGGGGINVSRAIGHMGGQSTAMVALGGATGTRIAEMLKADGLSLVRLTAPGETRQSLAVTDRVEQRIPETVPVLILIDHEHPAFVGDDPGNRIRAIQRPGMGNGLMRHCSLPSG